mmetsp:Transcript_26452/g.57712  ORF Transcript_26452/g.57712 Transcript_26452/m.57712 type:complete len:164 (-) Transcript_26452:473-964(-)|eukprot:CAMPEP_0202896864 /NCGR_PEP_ID=MMETSP1392-20130828/5769_1 /ASSEMBLY_ACC=CAM_ASM_000868 /TAXON_ID=225041 /ORGANISM="Chlamydomonas chlamydogama, Strain SAG 11-48b" /LENGTH=163 /DNA_ID=CAMNT_0049582353 /DNA_START=41 /DNA_END=532 /DNA_ORIENTATION=-
MALQNGLVSLGHRLPVIRQILAQSQQTFIRHDYTRLFSTPATPEAAPASSTTDVSKEKQAAAPAAESQPSAVEADDEWTEVVHQESGQIYYWNERTGETTQLGDPKPRSRRSEGGSSGGQSGQGATGERFDPSAESHMPDRTGTYAAMGAFIGAFLGWVSQFV